MNGKCAVFAVVASLIAGCRYFDDKDGCAGGNGFATEMIKGGAMADRTISLSFGGGPNASTSLINDFLFANGVQAAFFVAGKDVANERGLLSTMRERGHLIGSFGYTGEALGESEDPVSEMRKTDERIAPFISGETFLLRAPEGSLSEALARDLNEAGFAKYAGPIGWDVGDAEGTFVPDEECWERGIEVAKCIDGYLDEIRAEKRGIVRLRGDAEESVELTKGIVTKLKSEGYSFVRIDQTPEVKALILKAGGAPGSVSGPEGCRGY